MNESKTGTIENVHFDWLQCTFDYSDGMDILNSGSLGNFEADADAGGLHNYECHMKSYLGCEYHYSPNSRRMGVHVRMNGDALANYRAFPQIHDLEILRMFGGARKFTRLDVALNSPSIRLLATLCNRWKTGNTTSKKKKWEIIVSGQVASDVPSANEKPTPIGKTLYVGGKTSDCFYRCYDKAAQLKLLNLAWLRMEGQYRDEKATAMVNGLLTDNGMSEHIDKGMNYDIAIDDILSSISGGDLFDVTINDHSKLKVAKKETSLQKYFDGVLKVVGKNLHREETAEFIAGINRMIGFDL